MRRTHQQFSPHLPALARLGCAICASAITVAGCSSTPTEQVTTIENPVTPSLQDDTAPPETDYDPSLTYQGRYGIQENHSTERYRFDVAAYADDDERLAGEKLYPSHATFLQRWSGEAVPSVQTIGTYVKQLDDTIYAGVEIAVQGGLEPTLEPKTTILTGALEYLTEHRSVAADGAVARVAAALRLGGAEPAVPADLEDDVTAVRDDFLAAADESKPFGFYTWSEDLQHIWQQDRLLQREMPADQACALAEAIAADPARRDRYVQLTQLYTKLTNPLYSSLVPVLDTASDASCLALGSRAFLSRSETPEVALFNALYPDGIPADADLMGELITAIRQGSIDLTPKDGDGWYQHQLYALETLLVTDRSEERAKIAFMARYKQRLQEAFSSMLVQHRETHAKQADVAAGSVAMPLTPHFRLEPLATVYARHARSYVFLEAALESVLGAGALDAAVSVNASGPEQETLRARIERARDLLYGLYIVAAQDIGMPIALSKPGDPAPETWPPLASAADQWLGGLEADPIAQSDVRVIVPIAYLDSGRMKYWAVIGVRGTLGGYSYISGMDVSPPKPEDQARIWLPTEQFLEVESSPTPLTRQEFRQLCDQAGTAEAIKAALEQR